MRCRDCGTALQLVERASGFCLLCARDADERFCWLLSLGHVGSLTVVERSEIGCRAVEAFVDQE